MQPTFKTTIPDGWTGDSEGFNKWINSVLLAPKDSECDSSITETEFKGKPGEYGGEGDNGCYSR